jgi:alanyl-tRNA synthetase
MSTAKFGKKSHGDAYFALGTAQYFGNTVNQTDSRVDPKRLRCDFSHFEAVSY